MQESKLVSGFRHRGSLGSIQMVTSPLQLRFPEYSHLHAKPLGGSLQILQPVLPKTL